MIGWWIGGIAFGLILLAGIFVLMIWMSTVFGWIQWEDPEWDDPRERARRKDDPRDLTPEELEDLR